MDAHSALIVIYTRTTPHNVYENERREKEKKTIRIENEMRCEENGRLIYAHTHTGTIVGKTQKLNVNDSAEEYPE